MSFPNLAGAVLGTLFFFVLNSGTEARPGKPAPPVSRYAYTLEIDATTLPEGVTVRTSEDEYGTRHFIKNSGDIPLIIDQKFSVERLVAGTKLVGGKVYNYFPNGVPMEGKTHLNGWQAPFGDREESRLALDRDPAKIYEGRKPGLPADIPAAEEVVIPASYGGEPYEIRATVRYRLNPDYDGIKKG